MGTLTQDQLREIAEIKMPDLNANDIDAAMNIVAGTARSMGVLIEGREMKKKYVPRSMGVLIEGREMKKKYVPSKKLAAMLQGKSE